MPNYCSNYLKVEGDEKELKDFAEKFNENGIEAFVPTPKELNERQAPFKGTEEEKKKLIFKYGAADWYEWRIKNWGTKWNAELYSNGFFADDAFYIPFNTPWSPPIEAFITISEKYPKLHFELTYCESGMGFLGRAILEDGVLLDDNSYEWDFRFEPNVWPITKECITIEDEFYDLLEYVDDDQKDCLTKYMENELKFDNGEETRILLNAMLQEDEEYIEKLCRKGEEND